MVTLFLGFSHFNLVMGNALGILCIGLLMREISLPLLCLNQVFSVMGMNCQTFEVSLCDFLMYEGMGRTCMGLRVAHFVDEGEKIKSKGTHVRRLIKMKNRSLLLP